MDAYKSNIIIDMWYLKLIPKSYLSKQLRQPSGFVGRYLMSHLFKKGNADINRFVKQCLSLESTDHVLEIGFGPGYLTNQVAETLREGFVAGIDFSETMFNKASQLNKSHIKTGRVALYKGDSKNILMPDESFDKVYTVNTVYFFDNPKIYFNEMCRVLKKNGSLVVGFREKQQLENVALSNDVFTLYSQSELIHILKESGFEDVKIESQESTPFTSYCAIALKKA